MLRYKIKRDAKKGNKTKQLRPCGCCKGDALIYRRKPLEIEKMKAKANVARRLKI
jgi:hypothetical protein